MMCIEWAHYTNLVVQTLSPTLSLVSKIKGMLVSMYNYFAHSLKCHLETNKFIEILENKGNKIFINIKTHKIVDQEVEGSIAWPKRHTT
jgi:hypothetical protein